MTVPEQLGELRVYLVGYRAHDHGPRVERVDVVDVRTGAETLVSLSPLDAVALAGQLTVVAGWATVGDDPTG